MVTSRFISELSLSPVPAFKLYGESLSWPTSDLMHCESIAERSCLHDWEIKPHRHVDLMQMLYVEGGTALLKVEDMEVTVSTPALLIVPAMSIHSFVFSQDIRGSILTFAKPLVQALSTAIELDDLTQAGCLEIEEGTAHIQMLFDLIHAEYCRSRHGRELALQSLINLLMVWVGRKAAQRRGRDVPRQQPGVNHLHEFVSVLERRYLEHWPISRYASAVGISSNHLNSICRRIGGQSALQMINERLLLEAKRCLIYTEMTISQISDTLGFSEPAYFSRFFKRCSGISPKAFRSTR